MQLNVVQEVSKHAITFNEYVKSKGGLLLSSYVKSSEKIKLQCEYQHTWMATPASVKSGHWCPVCAGKSSSAAKDKFSRIVQEKGGVVLTNYTNNKTKVRVRCNNNHEWDVPPTDIIQGHWCAACAERCPKLAKEKLISAIDAKGGQLIGHYVSGNYKVTIRCAENHQWEANSLDVTSGGTWCPVCARNCPKAARENINRIISNNNWKALGHYVNDSTKIDLKCVNGHPFSKLPGNIRAGQGCPHCPKIRSKGEIQVSSILDKLNIHYIQEWRHPNLNHRRFDFEFTYNNMNYIIEYDGRQHFESRLGFDNLLTLQEKHEIDKIKTYVAYITNYNIIRLDYTLNIMDLETHIINALNSTNKIYVSNQHMYHWLLGQQIDKMLLNKETNGAF